MANDPKCECYIGSDGCMVKCPLCKAAPAMLKALREIAKAEGRFSRDPIEHAMNCIDSMRQLAMTAIAQSGGER